MKNNVPSIAALIVAVIASVYAGRSSLTPQLEAQGLGSSGRSPSLPPTGPVVVETEQQPDVLLYSEGSGGASAATNGILAVTGSYGVGTSVLYVIDTESKQLAVYEARGGSRTMRRLTLVGARRIDLDLQLRGYNDESEFQYAALEKMFDSRNRKKSAADPARSIDRSAERR